MPIATSGGSAAWDAAAELLKRPFAEAFPPQNIRHHFTGQDQARGIYAKELHIPAGYNLVSHKHPYDHLSILASGSVMWSSGKTRQMLTGPCAVTVDAGIEHELHALTDAVWFCIHPTDETDPDKVDPAILKRGEV